MLFILVSIFFAAVGGDCVVVTGATGFVAGHVIEVLFQKGYAVHGTVRDPSNEKKTAFLRELQAKYNANLELFKADLMTPNAFDLAAKGCSGFFHIASPVLSRGITPEAMVEAATRGTLSALTAAHKAKVKTMIVTSSSSTIAPTKAKMGTKLENCQSPYVETDWNDVCTIENRPYSVSKLQAERAVSEWLAKFDKPPFRVATTHFPYAFGPQQSTRVTSSNQVISSAIRGEYPFAVPMFFHGVDVRDVARGHVHLFEHEQASGRYIIALNQQISGKSYLDVSRDIAEAADLKSLPVATFQLSPWVFSLIARSKMDHRIGKWEAERAYIGLPCGYDGSKITRELGFEYEHTDVKLIVQEAARSMLRLGIADGKRHTKVAVKVISAVLALLVVVFLWGLCCCCCRRGKEKEE